MAKDLISLLGLPEKGPAMIAVVGAGGKTTTMLALAHGYKALNLRVLVTTTTRIYVPDEASRDFLILGTQDPRLLNAIPAGTITVVGEGVEDNGKLVSVSSEWLNRMYQEGQFEIILMEADGSKGKPLKAPASHEPVIPADSTHVIGVIGMDAFGQALSDRWIHRLEEFLAVTGGVAGQMIDEDMLVKLIGSPVGLFKNAPAEAQRILLLNKCTDFYRSKAAESLIAACVRQGAGNLTGGAWR